MSYQKKNHSNSEMADYAQSVSAIDNYAMLLAGSQVVSIDNIYLRG